MTVEQLVFGSDHAGINLKNVLMENLSREYEVIDVGTQTEASCDYPDYAVRLSGEILERNCLGILICGTGLGMSMAANRIKGVRAALCANEFMARMSRLHNNANVLCMGDRVIGVELGISIAREFLKNGFEAGRHSRRVDMIDSLT